MKNEVYSALNNAFCDSEGKKNWNNFMITTNGPGHTKEVSELQCVHSGRESAQYYAAALVFNLLDEEKGLGILNELSKLQIKDEKTNQRGGFRWYREESKIADTNAAFFNMQPLVFIRLFFPEKVPHSHTVIIDEMMSHALQWFSEECANPILYYPNKIMSDGAMLLGIASILKNEVAFKEGVEFYKRWDEYTDRRGWGWGENISFCYLAIIIDALQIARNSLREREPELKNKLGERVKEGLDFVRLHGKKEFIPTIRTYNFDGNENVYGWLHAAAKLEYERKDVGGDGFVTLPYSAIISLYMIDEFQYRSEGDTIRQDCSQADLVGKTHKERLFDDAFSYTWFGNNGKLGSVNKFPIIPGSYQHPTWGLGWQSMPVAFLVEGEQVSFLRMQVKEGDNLRAHPAIDKHKSYLNPALFREEMLPELRTYSAQNENLLLSIRSIQTLCNSASEITDCLVVKRFKGEVKTYEIKSEKGDGQKTVLKNDNSVLSVVSDIEPVGRKWTVLEFDKVIVAITPLSTIAFGDKASRRSKIDIIYEKGDLSLNQTIYKGKEKLLFQKRVEIGWAVVFVDEKMKEGDLQEFLESITIKDESAPDFEVPRDGYTLVRNVSIEIEGKKASLRYDPHYM